MKQLSTKMDRRDTRQMLRYLQLTTCENSSGKAQKAVLKELAAYAERDGFCNPGIESLARDCSLSVRAVKYALKALCKQELVIRERPSRLGMLGRGSLPDIYSIDWEKVRHRSIERVDRDDRDDRDSCRASMMNTSNEVAESSIVQFSPFEGAKRDGFIVQNEACPSCKTVEFDRAKNAPKDIREAKREATTTKIEAAEDDLSSVWTDEAKRSGLELLSRFVARPRLALDSAMEAGIAPSELAAICAEFTANQALFHSAGAIVDRIRNGSWPVAGVKSIEEIAKASEVATKRKANLDREKIRFDVVAELRRSGRWESSTDAEIDREVDRRAMLP